ncbi:MAG: SH3 domain-containing protein, partial [Candidatus Wallbacteria bacterium]|nr:SH3 domain-containing protein [Candidatus Wallbacteria bacterium]
IMPHKEMPGCNTDCPGNCPWDDLMNLIKNNGQTPDPVPTPDPIPGEGNPGIVNSSDGANVRKGPDTSYSIIVNLPHGSEVKVTGEKDGWFTVIIPDGQSGYIYKNLIVTGTDLKTGTTSGTVNVRKGPGTDFSILATLASGAQVRIFSQSGDWYEVKLTDGQVGFIYKNLLAVN